LIPSGYVGWINVYFGVRDAPQTPKEDGYYVFKIPSTGELKTSTKIESGLGSDEFFYFTAEGTKVKLESTGWDGGGMIWAATTGNENGGPYSVRFFVGTEEQLRRYGFQMPEQSGPIPKL